MSRRAIEAYNDPERANSYHQARGFDPPRKERMLEVVARTLLELTPRGTRLLELGAGTGDLRDRLKNRRPRKGGPVCERGPGGGDGSSACVPSLRPGGAHETVPSRGTWSSRPIWLRGSPPPADREGTQAPPLQTPNRSSRRSLSQPDWHLPHLGQFGAVCSSMAFHHAADKAGLFGQILEVLEPGGVLVFSDHMSGSNIQVDRLIGWERARVRLGSSDDLEQVQTFIAKDQAGQRAEGNLCESVPEYLEYLARGGFAGADCIWRDYWMAVFVAFKP